MPPYCFYRKGVIMLKISWKLDNEDGLDPVDPTGEICLSSKGSGLIFEEYTYLDSWFDALADGFLAAEKGVPGIVEILEEPDALKFEPLGHGGVRVAYKDQNLEIRDTDHALCILRQSVRAFLSEFGGDGEILKNRLLIKLRDFSEKEFRPVYNAESEKNSDMNSELRVA